MTKLKLSKQKPAVKEFVVKHVLRHSLRDVYVCYDCNDKISAYEYSRNNKKIRNIVPGSSPEAIIDECFYVDDRDECAKDLFVDKYGYDPKYIDIMRADVALESFHKRISQEAEEKGVESKNSFQEYTTELGKLKSVKAKVEFVENYLDTMRFSYVDIKPLMFAVKKEMCKELKIMRKIDEQENQSANEI